MFLFHSFLSYLTKHRNLQNLWYKRPQNSYIISSGLPESSQQPPADSQGTPTRSQFGELIWRAHLESSFWYNLMQKENWFLVWFNQWYLWIFYQIFLNLYFDKRNQPGQHLQVTFHVFFKSNLLFDIKSRKLISILCFDR